MKTKMGLFAAVAIGAVLAISGCGDSSTSQKSTNAITPATGGEPLPANLILKEAPAGAKDVGTLKKEAREGDAVVIRGQVGGSKDDDFNQGRAAFTIVDMKLPACSMKPGDTCETPWDFCCESKESLAANTAMIQIVDAAGKPLKATVQGKDGIDHLSVLVVKGTVAKREEQNLVVNATGIYVEKTAPKKQ